MGAEKSWAESMRKVPYTELEIIGFNDTVKSVPCARVTPIVQHIQTKDYSLLLSGDNSGAKVDTWWTRAEIESFVAEGRATFLPESEAIVASPSATMMVYVTSGMLEVIGPELPPLLNGETLHRWTLQDSGTLVVCASSITIDDLMASWARQILGKTTDLLVNFFAYSAKEQETEAESSRQKAEDLARMARSAAVNRTLRSQVLLRLGVALIHSDTPERWTNLREMILRTFKDWEWETLTEQLNLFANLLRTRISQNGIEINKDKETTERKRGILENVISIVGIADEKERRRVAQIYIREHRELYPVDETTRSRIEEELIRRSDPWIYLEDSKLVFALAGEETLYNPDVFIKLPSNRPAVNLVPFFRKIKRERPMLSGADDLIDAVSLASKLKTGPDPLSIYLRGRLSENAGKLLDQYQPPHQLSQELKEVLVDEINKLISGTSLYEEERFRTVPLAKETRELIEQKPQESALLRLNRMLLEEAYPQEIAKSRIPGANRVQKAAAGGRG